MEQAIILKLTCVTKSILKVCNSHGFLTANSISCIEVVSTKHITHHDVTNESIITIIGRKEIKCMRLYFNGKKDEWIDGRNLW